MQKYEENVGNQIVQQIAKTKKSFSYFLFNFPSEKVEKFNENQILVKLSQIKLGETVKQWESLKQRV